MYARVTLGECQPNKVDEAIEVWKSTLPSYRQVTGFQSADLLVDRDSNRIVMISLWDTEEHSRAHVESGGMMQALSQFFDLLTELPSMEGYEVAGHMSA